MPAGFFEEGGALRVEGDLFGCVVAAAVDFEDEAQIRAGEVHDIRPDRVLAAKLEAFPATVAQAAPEFCL